MIFFQLGNKLGFTIQYSGISGMRNRFMFAYLGHRKSLVGFHEVSIMFRAAILGCLVCSPWTSQYRGNFNLQQLPLDLGG